MKKCVSIIIQKRHQKLLLTAKQRGYQFSLKLFQQQYDSFYTCEKLLYSPFFINNFRLMTFCSIPNYNCFCCKQKLGICQLTLAKVGVYQSTVCHAFFVFLQGRSTWVFVWSRKKHVVLNMSCSIQQIKYGNIVVALNYINIKYLINIV